MTLNQMKYFITVAECLSFTEAAKCLFITQPALSRQITAMEDELGTSLLRREKKRLKLTPGGLLLYQRFKLLLEEYNQAVRDAQTANLGYEGTLHMGFLDIYDVSEMIAPVLAEFQRSYPDIQMSLERYSLGDLPEKLAEDQLDLVLTYGFSLFDQPDLMTVDIQDFRSTIMLHKDHPLAGCSAIDLSELEGETFVQLAPAICQEGQRFIVSLLNKSGIHPKIMPAQKMEDMMLWVQTGNAVAITTNRTIERFNPNVVIRDIDMDDASGHTVTMAWRRNNFNPAIALFMELLENAQNRKNERRICNEN